MNPIEELIKEMQDLKKTKLYQESFKAIEDCIHLAYAKLNQNPKHTKKGDYCAVCGSDEFYSDEEE